MIKAPFRFDIEYFSIIVVISQSTGKQIQQGVNEDQKEQSMNKLNKGELVPEEYFNRQESQNCLKPKKRQELLYFVAQNKESLEFYGSVHTNKTVGIETKMIFRQITQLYSYIKYNCSCQIVKMTKRGNLLLDYFIGESIYQLKIENKPLEMIQTDIEMLWKDLKGKWENKKESGKKMSHEYLDFIKKGNLKIQQIEVNEQYENEELLENFTNYKGFQKQSSRGIRKQNPNVQKWKEMKKKMKRKPNYYTDASVTQSGKIESQQIRNMKEYRLKKNQDQKYKNQKGVRKYVVIDKQEGLNKKSQYKVYQSKKKNQNMRCFQCDRRQQQLLGKNDQWSWKRIEKSLRRVQTSLDKLQVHNREQVFQIVNQLISQKVDEIIDVITKNFNQQRQSIKKLAEGIQRTKAFSCKSNLSNKPALNNQNDIYQEKAKTLILELKQANESITYNKIRGYEQIRTDNPQDKLQNGLNSVKNKRNIKEEKDNKEIRQLKNIPSKMDLQEELEEPEQDDQKD